MHYTKYPFKRVGDKTINYSTDPVAIEARVEKTYNKIVDVEANTADGDGILGYDFNSKGVFKAGVRPLMSRVLDIPTKDIKEFDKIGLEIGNKLKEKSNGNYKK